MDCVYGPVPSWRLGQSLGSLRLAALRPLISEARYVKTETPLRSSPDCGQSCAPYHLSRSDFVATGFANAGNPVMRRERT